MALLEQVKRREKNRNERREENFFLLDKSPGVDGMLKFLLSLLQEEKC
jgi:hypothetical protein